MAEEEGGQGRVGRSDLASPVATLTMAKWGRIGSDKTLSRTSRTSNKAPKGEGLRERAEARRGRPLSPGLPPQYGREEWERLLGVTISRPPPCF
ncbi:hypothetical protein CRG98_025316 [Punica granatum]|uniref:Uncharacterized protein n=1 Tax=Punica granatum TaxID=22663 RepID=A0A2I0JDH7_PUNGR|nr:hypothetical protein CRG98_025316 [Punica granatum]